MEKIHSEVNVYANGERKCNGVAAEDLEKHIAHNKSVRQGRAIFIDGKCVHRGNLTQTQVDVVLRDLKKHPYVPYRITRPYQ